MQSSHFRFAALAWLFSAGCSQVAGLGDYTVAAERRDDNVDSVETPDAESDDAELDDASGDAEEPDPVDTDGASPGDPTPNTATMDAALDAGMLVTLGEASVPVDSTVPVDSASLCSAPNRMCGMKCVAADDPRHCGACDHDCTGLANVVGTVSCRDGQCVVPASACATNYAHCSQNADDGCEANVSVAARCGACGTSCSAAAPLCAATSAGAHSCVSECVAPSPTKCGETCVDTMSSTAHCGGCNMPCAQVTRGSPTCGGGQCGFTCNSGYHKCGSQCLANDSAGSCGSSCTPCTSPSNGTATCSAATSCDFSCNTNFHRCGASCLPNNAVSSCGSACTPCTAPANATATCSAAGACDFTCNTNYHRCGNVCVPDDSISQCGASCQVCPGAPDGVPECAAGACRVRCSAGGSLVNGACTPARPAKRVAVGEDTSCAILNDDTVRCWGNNQNLQNLITHQLGPQASGLTSSTPMPIAGLAGVTDIGMGQHHVCAVSAGTVYCWGGNEYGQLGPMASGLSNSASPIAVPGVSSVLQLSGSMWETAALVSGGTLSSWGAVGSGVVYTHHGAASVTRMSYSGNTNACERLSSGAVRCFGDNTYGTLGVDPASLARSATPVTIAGVPSATDVSLGSYSGCAVTAAGKVWCWGNYAMTGPHQSGTTTARPAELPGISNARGVAVGYTSTCAWTSDGAAYCWGDNVTGKLGQPTSLAESRTPLQVPALADVVELAVGNHHVCARTTRGWVKCWGNAYYGNLGPTATGNSSAPIIIPF
jgi:hypothetical protein